MSITIKNHRDRDLVEILAEGVVTDEDMFSCQESLFENKPMCHQLWDMSAADLSRITAMNMRRFVEIAAELGQARKGCSTVVVVRSNLQYGLGRMAQVFGEFEGLPFDFQLFRRRADALAWLEANHFSKKSMYK